MSCSPHLFILIRRENSKLWIKCCLLTLFRSLFMLVIYVYYRCEPFSQGRCHIYWYNNPKDQKAFDPSVGSQASQKIFNLYNGRKDETTRIISLSNLEGNGIHLSIRLVLCFYHAAPSGTASFQH